MWHLILINSKQKNEKPGNKKPKTNENEEDENYQKLMYQTDETMINHMDDTVVDPEITVVGGYQVYTEPTSPEVKRT